MYELETSFDPLSATVMTVVPGPARRLIDLQPTQLAELPWAELEDGPASMTRRYSGLSLDLGDFNLRYTEADVRHAAAKYGAAVAHAFSMYRHLLAKSRWSIEVEVSVDETNSVTTLLEHAYMATQMNRLGMRWVAFAPRYIGDFEKGVDYKGDPRVLYESVVSHAKIARAFGPYKISLHSGSDKVSIYDLIAEATGGLVHLKTSGTSYLVALDIVARFEPALFRLIYTASRNAYRDARASYLVSARLEKTPECEAVPGQRLVDLVSEPNSRQILHVEYGAVLRSQDEREPSQLWYAIRDVITARSEAYEGALASHIGRHLTPFSKASTAAGGQR